MATKSKSSTPTITVQQLTPDPSLITINDDDHTFTLKPGNYTFDLQMQPPRGFTNTHPEGDPEILEMSRTALLRGDIHAEDGITYLFQYLDGRQWKPIQTLPDSDYTITLTKQ
jgi:hypothetical protein